MRNLLATLSVLSLVCCTGCMTAAKQGLAEVKGASADIYPTKMLSPGKAQAASARTFTVVSDGTGAERIRGALQTALNKRAAELKSKGKLPAGGGGPLTVKATVRFFTAKGAGKLLGGMSFAIVRVDVLDQSGAPVAQADCLSSTKAMRTGTQDLANALAEKIIEWISTGKT